MRALTVHPGVPHSARLEELPEPPLSDGPVLVQAHSLGICGTDAEILRGEFGAAPPGAERLVLGHESLGQVLEAPRDSGLAPGDWVVGMVRRPDPVPCEACAAQEWDMCRNGQYTEHGIRGLHGFGAERYRLPVASTVRLAPKLGALGVLTEPTSVVAKAWEQLERIAARAVWAPRRVLITGAGPIGLLAALLGVQRRLEVHVLDRVEDGPKPALVRALGATYHAGSVAELGTDAWDILLECTGASALLFDVIRAAAPAGIVCLTGVSAPGDHLQVDAGGLNRELVLQNNVVFGTVNANRRHYVAAERALSLADPTWLQGLLTRRVPLARWAEALRREPGDVKTVLGFS